MSGSTYYFYWTNGYDNFYGYTYDEDASQGLYDGYTYTATDENGLLGTYTVYSVESGDPNDLPDDCVRFTSYYDSEPDVTISYFYYGSRYYPYDYYEGNSSDAMLAASARAYYGFTGFNTYSGEGFFGRYGYDEADDPETGDVQAYTHYFYWYNGTDSFRGYTYDGDETQGLYEGYRYTSTDETGASGYYYVYESVLGNQEGLLDDYVAFTFYYDGEIEQYDYDPYYTTLNGYAGTAGMLEALDYVDFGDGDLLDGEFGSYGYYEAEAYNGVTYAYFWSNGYDMYYGYTFDDDGSQGLSVGYTYSATDENGLWGYYYVYSATFNNIYNLDEDGAFHLFYYDGETGAYDYDPLLSTEAGQAAGSGMLGSFDYVDFGNGGYAGGDYGYYGYFEADDQNLSGTTYAYYWYNGFDFYYGYTFDSDGSQGLYDGYLYYTTDENGLSGYYYVYSSTDQNSHLLTEDAAFHDYYYDYATDTYDWDPYYSDGAGYAYGTGMLGSYDRVDFDNGDYTEGTYGDYGYYEAENVEEGFTYYYYWTNGYDSYRGYTFDLDGSQGLYEGYQYDATDENGYAGFYYVDAAEHGDVEGLGGDDLVAHQYYYDYETGLFDLDPLLTTTDGHTAGYGMLDSYDYVEFEDGDDTGGLYGAHGYYEADEYGTTYYYYWLDGDGQDYYYGYTFDGDGSQGLYAGYVWTVAGSDWDVEGYDQSGYYYVYASAAGNPNGLAADDFAYHQYYFDYETRQYDYDPVYTSTNGAAYGSGMIASYDYVVFDEEGSSSYNIDLGTYGSYGREADGIETPGTTYYYVWSNGYDYYYGYVYDYYGDRSGLSVGYSVDVTMENGLTSNYYVYDSTEGNPYRLEHEEAVHTHYYDYQTDQYDYDPYYSTVEGAARGTGMLGTYDQVDFGVSGADDIYGNYGGNMWEADA